MYSYYYKIKKRVQSV